MYPHSFLWHYLWLAPHALQAFIVFIMVRRKLVHEFPVFLTYTVFQVVQSGTLFVLDHLAAVSAVQYWEAYWVGLVATIILRFTLIHEIFAHVFREYPALQELVRLLFRWAAALLILVAVGVSAYAPPTQGYRFLTAVYVVNRAVGLIQAGLLVFLFLFSSYFKLAWRSYVYGIALGLGIFASVDLATSAIRTAVGPSLGNYQFDFITMVTYHCCVLIWLLYLLAPESSHRAVKALPADNLERWNSELERLLLQ
jgi:hypothetical protein